MALVGCSLLGTVATEPAGGEPPATTATATSLAPVTTVPSPTTTPSTTTLPPAPEVHPHLSVRRVPAGRWVTGAAATAGAIPALDAHARTGHTVRFVFRVRHDGTATQTIRLGAAGRHPRATVRWLSRGRDVTTRLARGGIDVALAPGARRDFVLSVTLSADVADRFALARTLVASIDRGPRHRVRAVIHRVEGREV